MKVLRQRAAVDERRGAYTAPDPLAQFLVDARAGDRDKLGRILEAVAPAVLAVVRVILGPNNSDAQDVAQESLLAVKDALRGFRGEASVMHYARQVAVRTALSARRGRTTRERLLEQFRRESAAGPSQVPAVDPILRARRTAAFRALLDDLPDEQAETFALRVVLDYSLDQIARATGAPLNTVRSRVRLAREKLKQRIESDPDLMDVLRGDP
jgi:RNA polymerase sigma-70 factor (ECF subfamily)